MPRFRFASLISAPVERVWAFHEAPDALEKLLPPDGSARVLERRGGLEPGSTVELEVRLGPLRRRWLARHTECVRFSHFCDVQERGPFRVWRHRHGFEAADGGRCRLTDDVEFSLPLAPVSDWLGAPVVKQILRKMFEWRHARTAEECGAEILEQSCG
ncbi:MAG: cyclase [Bryobacteraceae bacterium]|nr:MAG: cyclase [Bryobacteraceae bacterium]